MQENTLPSNMMTTDTEGDHLQHSKTAVKQETDCGYNFNVATNGGKEKEATALCSLG